MWRKKAVWAAPTDEQEPTANPRVDHGPGLVGAAVRAPLSQGRDGSLPLELDGDDLAEPHVPEEARGDVDQLLPRIAARLAAGDHAGAAILYHAWQLVELHARGVIELAKGKTNRRYAAEVAALTPALAELFAATTRLSERARFGRLPVTAEEFEGVWRERGRFEAGAAVEATP